MQEKTIAHKIQGYLHKMEADSWRHEDYGRGVPDISFQLPLWPGGWIELKVISPTYTTAGSKAKLSTVLQHELTEAQRRWMIRRSQKGGYCCIIAACDQFYIHWNQYIIDHFPRITWQKALDVGTQFKTFEDFSAVLKRDLNFRLRQVAHSTDDLGSTRRIFGAGVK